MSPARKGHITRLKKQIALATRRQQRWIGKREAWMLKLVLEGKMHWTPEEMRGWLYRWEIEMATQRIDSYTTKLKEWQRDDD